VGVCVWVYVCGCMCMVGKGGRLGLSVGGVEGVCVGGGILVFLYISICLPAV
jgi:hypothetical protein